MENGTENDTRDESEGLSEQSSDTAPYEGSCSSVSRVCHLDPPR
jgi:hypothetical protein